jgi:hypothetical protein
MNTRLITVLVFFALTAVHLSPGQAGPAIDGTPKPTMVILVDTSGSMKRVTTEVHAALTAFIDGLKPGWQVLLVRFDVFSELLESVEIAGQPDRERLKRQLGTLRFIGRQTNFDEGLKGAQAALFQAGVLRNAEVVIFSDGLSDPSQSKARLDLTALCQRVFPQHDGYGIYLLTVSPGVSPGQQAPTTQGNVTSMAVSRGNVPEILAVIEQRVVPEPEPPAAVPPAPPPPESPAPASPQAATLVPIAPPAGRAPGWWGLYAVMALALAGAGLYLGWGSLAGRLPWGRRGQPVRLQLAGQQDTVREFWLGEGESLRIGSGICDYPLPTASSVIVTRQNGALVAGPADFLSDVTLAGQPLQGSTAMPHGAVLVVDGHLYVSVNG